MLIKRVNELLTAGGSRAISFRQRWQRHRSERHMTDSNKQSKNDDQEHVEGQPRREYGEYSVITDWPREEREKLVAVHESSMRKHRSSVPFGGKPKE